MSELDDQQFGKYKLLNRIAIGGMAELYQAKLIGDQGFEKLVAIKKILPYLAEETKLIKSFIDEAKLAAYLQHPNIVQVYDFGSVDNTYFIAMEYLYGKDLTAITKQYKEKGMPLSIENALYIITQVCSGLEYAHKLKDFRGKPLNIIHRDIGPHNIFITYGGQVKIIDFGIAKAATQRQKTQIGSIKGKIAYMAPEQAQAEKIDHRSDIYAMGILLYEMLTHERMFDGDTYSVFTKVLESEYTPAREVNKELPPDLCDIIDKALKKDREERYQAAEEMLSDVENCMHTHSIISSYRNLAQYMKDLFDEGAESEAVKTDSGTDSTSEISETIVEPKFDKTVVLGQEELPSAGKKSHIPLFVFSVLILIASIFFLLLFIKHPEPLLSTLSKTFNLRDSGSGVSPEMEKNIIHPKDRAGIKTSEDSSASKDMTQSYEDQPDQAVTDSPRVKEGIRLLKEEKFTEAASLFGDLLRTEPQGNDEVSVLYCQALIGQASKISAKYPERAKALLLKAVKIIPGNPQGHYLLGRIYTQQKDFTSAMASYQTAIELDPQMSNAYFNLGYIYAIKKDYAKAQDMFSRATELSPPFLDEALYNLAIVQRKMGNIQDCIKNLERAVTVNPENKKAKRLLGTLKK